MKNAKGHSRGFAFVEFETLTDLMQALDVKTGFLHGRSFKISKSNREISFKKQTLDKVKDEETKFEHSK